MRRRRGPPPFGTQGRGSGATARALLLAGLVAALGGCVDSDPRTVRHREVAAADRRQAEAALRRYGCIDCHLVPGIRGADALVGPPLFAYAERRYVAGRVPNETDYLIAFIVDPQSIKPGSAMPTTGISAQEARHIAAYLYTLR